MEESEKVPYVRKESLLNRYPNVISYECTKKIIEQMEKFICKIKIGETIGTAFFCEIPFPNKNNMFPVLISNNHTINRDFLFNNGSELEIHIKEKKDIIKLNLDKRMKYTNEEYDITIIELKETDEIKNFLELDDIIIDDIINNNNKNKEFIDKTIYIIQYPESELSVSYGLLDNIYADKNYNFIHKCSTKNGSSGSPIMNMSNKIIGVHKEGYKDEYNIGSFLNEAIKEFIQQFYYHKDISDNKNDKNIILNEYNKKYNLDIKDINIEKLDLSSKNIGNEGLEYLSKIEFKKLKNLDLSNNNISNISALKSIKFKNLEILDLSNNKISDIDVLEKVSFKGLKELNLNNNKITNINILEKVNFNELKILNLHKNNISDLKVLDKVKFEKLKLFI